LLHNSYHELAYLHPDFFTPDEAVIKKYGFSPYTYIIIRNSALKAHHDIGAKGLSGEVWDRVNKVIKDYPQITSHEGAKSQKIEPWDMHHVLAFSKMIISDSLSMSVEAAVLGVPAIRYNSFVGRVSVLNELENKYDLTYGFNASDSESATAMIYKIEELLAMAHLPEIWQEKRQKMLSEKINFTTWMIDLFNNIVLDKRLCK
jgi:predicted glycosyltransferase